MDIKKDNSRGQFIRFCINGVVAAAIHYGVYYLLQLWTDVNIAYTTGYLVSFVINFFATNYFTFHTKPTWKNFVGFATSHIVNYVLHIVLFNIFLKMGIHRLVAPPLVMLVAMLVQFTILRFVFKGRGMRALLSSPYARVVVYLITIHLLGLAILSLFRLVMFVALYAKMSVTDDNPVGAFLRGLWFDNVVGCYILVVPLIVSLLAASFGWTPRRMIKGVMVYVATFYVIVFAITAANMPYYAYFAKNINSSIFNWFSYAGTTTGMIVGERSYWLYIALFLVVTAIYLWLMHRLTKLTIQAVQAGTEETSSPHPRRNIKRTLCRLTLTLLLSGLCIFGIRGRIGYNPIKVSQAYYCNDPFLNQLGIAPAFNLLTSWLDDMRLENKELHLMAYDDAITYTRQHYGITGTVDSLNVLRRHVAADTTATKPNIVIILMESMSASLMHTFGQQERVTPTLDSLYQCSWAFTNCYSAGIHTNHGITAALYSFPALMKRNLMKGTVTPHRQGLPTVLKSMGYHNMFFMTHESQYDNMNAFLLTNGFDEVFAQEDYPSSEKVNAFGVSDHFLFDYGLKKLNDYDKKKEPWMATLLTISNHPPYIVPDRFKAHSKDDEMKIVEYADWCIGNFLRQSRQQPWYANTLFVIMADHGKIVGNVDSELPESYNHIPLIIFGPGVTPHVTDDLATQVDVMPTILSMIGADYDYDGFGIDLTKNHRDKVFYTADDQVVARDRERRFIYMPATDQTFCEGGEKNAFDDLRQYVFAMIQTAEFIYLHPSFSNVVE